MFEQTLENLIPNFLVSLDSDLTAEFTRICDAGSSCDTFDTAYKYMMQFFQHESFNSIMLNAAEGMTSESLKDLPLTLKPLAELYCCYFAMDYVYRQEHPQKVKYALSFIREFYDLDGAVAGEKYNLIRQKIKKMASVIDLEDPMLKNPGMRIGKYNIEHIYMGHIIEFLQKTCSTKEDALYSNYLAPSIIFTALASMGSLPNGAYTNRSRTKISMYIITTIDDALRNDFFYDKKILYENTSTETACLINYASADDLYRIDRLNYALKKYVEVRKSEESIRPINEIALARMCSLLLCIPKPLIKTMSPQLDKLIERVRQGSFSEALTCVTSILGLTSIIIPYMIGGLCSLLFWDSETNKLKEIQEIKNIIANFDEKIEHDSNFLKEITFDADRIATNSDIGVSDEAKGNGHSYKKCDFTFNHNHSLSEILGYILNQESVIAQSRIIIDENSFIFKKQLFVLKCLANYGTYPDIKDYSPTKLQDKFSPHKYIDSLSKQFILNLYK